MLVCRDGGLPGAEKIPQRLFVSSARRETFLLRHFSYTPEKKHFTDAISVTPERKHISSTPSVQSRCFQPTFLSQICVHPSPTALLCPGVTAPLGRRREKKSLGTVREVEDSEDSSDIDANDDLYRYFQVVKKKNKADNGIAKTPWMHVRS